MVQNVTLSMPEGYSSHFTLLSKTNLTFASIFSIKFYIQEDAAALQLALLHFGAPAAQLVLRFV